MTYTLLKTAEFIIQNIPLKAGYFVFRAAGELMFLFGGKRRATLRRNLEIMTGKPVPYSMLRQVYRNYACYYCDLFQTRESILKRVDGRDFEAMHLEQLKAQLATGRGFITVSMHLGNWDAAGAYLCSLFPGRVNIIVEELSPDMYRWFTETRQRFGAKIITATDGKSIIRALKSGEVVVLAADRDLYHNGYVMDFFGHKAYIPSGPAKLSALSGAPMLIGATIRKKDDPYTFYPFAMPDLLCMPEGGRSPAAIEALAKKVVEYMEKSGRPYPEQWCMLQEVFVPEEEQRLETGDKSKT